MASAGETAAREPQTADTVTDIADIADIADITDIDGAADIAAINDHLASTLRRTYPRSYAILEKAIASAADRIDLPAVRDIEIHADRLRLTGGPEGPNNPGNPDSPTSQINPDGAVAEIRFDAAAITPPGGVFDFVLDPDRQALFLLGGREDTDNAQSTENTKNTDEGPAPADQRNVFDLLRPYYWLVEGAKEPGADLLELGLPGIRTFLAEVANRDDTAVVHRWIRAAAQALGRDREAGASEVAQNLRRASVELRRAGIEPGLQRTLDDAAQVATGLRHGVHPVLAIRRVPRAEILRALGADDAASQRQTFADPGFARSAEAHAISADALASLTAEGLLGLVADLRECEFFALFLAGRATTGKPAVIVPQTLRESTKLAHSLSRANAYLFSREESRRMDRNVQDYLPNAGRGRQVAGFFPGLGSRAFYQDLGRELLDCGVPEVTAIYHEAAEALGFPGEPERLVMDAANLPAGRLAVQGFIGAALLVHSLAVEARLRAGAAAAEVPVRFVAYTGESFGIITAAVAAGALSVGDGVKLGRAFTPLVLTAADGVGPQDRLAAEMAAYLPEELRGRPLVPEPYHVVGLRGEPAELAGFLAAVAEGFPVADVEVHKLYSRRQTNVYVRAGAKADFDRFAARFPGVQAEELKPPTTFLAHSERMGAVRRAYERFMRDNGIEFRKPHTPLVSNNDAGLLTTAAEVREGVLAITDQVMASRTAAETLEGLRPDVVVELGLGGKSVQLLLDNDVSVPVTAYTGAAEDTENAGDGGTLLRALRAADTVLTDLEKLYPAGDRLGDRHHASLREVFRLSERDPFCRRYLDRTIGRIIANEMPHAEHAARAGSPAFYRFLEVYQHTANFRDHIDVGAGELVLQARVKKRLVGDAEELGRAYAELTVLDAFGVAGHRGVVLSGVLGGRRGAPEAVVFHFDQLPGVDYADLARNTRLLLDGQPLARRIYDDVFAALGIADDGFLTPSGATAPTVDELAVGYLVYQYALFHLLRLHRPAMFLHGYHLAGSDPMGWLVALAVSKAAALPDVVRLYAAYLRAGAQSAETRAALSGLLAGLAAPEAPLLAPDGSPLSSKIDVEGATRVVFD